MIDHRGAVVVGPSIDSTHLPTMGKLHTVSPTTKVGAAMLYLEFPQVAYGRLDGCRCRCTTQGMPDAPEQ